jgi:hypothetical protein
MDFVQDQLATGQKIHALTVLDTGENRLNGLREGRHAGLLTARQTHRQRFLEAFNGRLLAECLEGLKRMKQVFN